MLRARRVCECRDVTAQIYGRARGNYLPYAHRLGQYRQSVQHTGVVGIVRSDYHGERCNLEARVLEGLEPRKFYRSQTHAFAPTLVYSRFPLLALAVPCTETTYTVIHFD